jgi:hypothetical protein
VDTRVYAKPEINCAMADCESNLHCFRTSKKLQKHGIEKGHCRYCNINPIDWERLYRKDIRDIQYLISALQFEKIRYGFWATKEPTLKMTMDIIKLSERQLREKIIKRLKSSVSKPKSKNPYDGRQTPVDENMIHWAQHAIGTCCRVCLDQWYGIDAEATISDADYDYLTDVMIAYIKYKLSLSYADGSEKASIFNRSGGDC